MKKKKLIIAVVIICCVIGAEFIYWVSLCFIFILSWNNSPTAPIQKYKKQFSVIPISGSSHKVDEI